MMGRKVGGSLRSRNLGLLSTLSGRRQVVKVDGANPKIRGRGQDGNSLKNKIFDRVDQARNRGGEDSGFASNGDAQGEN